MVPSRYLGAKTQLVQRKARAFPNSVRYHECGTNSAVYEGTFTLVPYRSPIRKQDVDAEQALMLRRR